jgi:hypothetical protein
VRTSFARPSRLGAAEELARNDKHQFQLWALSMTEAQPYKGGKKGADTGIDGFHSFKPDGKTTEKAIVENDRRAAGSARPGTPRSRADPRAPRR